MDLPEIEVVGAEAAEGLLELSHRRLRVATVRAHFRHEKDALAPPLRQRFPHALLAFAVVVFPRVVHERDAGVDRLMDNASGLGLRVDDSEVIAAESEDGDVGAGAAEGASGDGYRGRALGAGGHLGSLGFRTIR
jgi:hypothetical protein